MVDQAKRSPIKIPQHPSDPERSPASPAAAGAEPRVTASRGTRWRTPSRGARGGPFAKCRKRVAEILQMYKFVVEFSRNFLIF